MEIELKINASDENESDTPAMKKIGDEKICLIGYWK